MKPRSSNEWLGLQKQRFEVNARGLRHKVSSFLDEAVKKVGLVLHMLLEENHSEDRRPDRSIDWDVLRTGQTLVPDDGLEPRHRWEGAVERLQTDQCEEPVFSAGLRVDLSCEDRRARWDPSDCDTRWAS